MQRRNAQRHLAAQAGAPLGVVFPAVPACGLRGTPRRQEWRSASAGRGRRKVRRAHRGMRSNRDERRPVQPRRGRSDRAPLPPRMPHSVGIVDRRSGLRTVGHRRARAHAARGPALAHIATACTTDRRLTHTDARAEVIAAVFVDTPAPTDSLTAPHPGSQGPQTVRGNSLGHIVFHDASLRLKPAEKQPEIAQRIFAPSGRNGNRSLTVLNMERSITDQRRAQRAETGCEAQSSNHELG
jgi:hypothetical protein